MMQGNILIDIHCQAIITDFGLSKVMEDLSSTVPEIAPTSLFAGSMRWMAPELVLALIEDDGRPPSVTKYSDVYAFASVCIEVCFFSSCLWVQIHELNFNSRSSLVFCLILYEEMMPLLC